ncbi:MAG: D,D-heptose 1,7-bisphosphate phosphatase [Gammaproteobacteria bacterium RIFCSPHIGHO2_12_FULL_37_14]|nr:MAG: D,D-heptose 1,7-bisphosphate phosphatase [Gammaproteobacteria bacterium RIFCSPHIGHO2_12_FULL_37_14]
MKLKAIFLDRDGVLNKVIIKNGKPYPPDSLETVIVPTDAFSALQILKQADFLLIGASNQPDVARGKTSRFMVESINRQLLTMLPLDSIRVCYHDDADHCDCRKPLPGLLVQAALDYNIELTSCYMIGDRWRDVEAGKRAGCKTVWLDYHYQEPFLSSQPDFTTSSLSHAANWIIADNVRKPD